MKAEYYSDTGDLVVTMDGGKRLEIDLDRLGSAEDTDAIGALLAASPRLALACQSAVALTELIERFAAQRLAPPLDLMDLRVLAAVVSAQARQALVAAGVAAEGGAGDE